jgi:protein-tyrosine phosphatase
MSNSRLPKFITENFNVLWINILDDCKTNIKEYFKQTNEFLYLCKEKNEKVLVHCQMGISRSSTIVLAYLIKFVFIE